MPLNLPSWKDPQARRVYILVGTAVGGAVLYMWWRARSSAAVAPGTASVDSGSVTDAAGGGLAPGGNVQYGGANIGSSDTAPTTNSEWTQYAVDLMIQNGWDGMTVASALGKYLANQPMTDTEINVVRSALALAGTPPVGSFTIRHVVGTEPETPTPTTPTETGGRYRVQAGDNWNKIAAKFGVSTATLLAANANDPSRGFALSVGDYIRLPGGVTAPATAEHGGRYRVKAGDNWNSIAADYGVTTEALLAANPSDPSRGHALAVGDYIWLPA